MSDWSKENYAHWGTYRGLAVLKELDPLLVSFDESKEYLMPGLSFYVLGTNSEDIKARATLLAMQLYQFVVVNYKPSWQNQADINSTREAINSICEILTDKDRTISDLGNRVDKVFKFSNEKGNGE